MHAEMLVLRFNREVVDQPIIYRLVKDFDLEFNLLKATIYPQKEGVMVMELRGHPQNFRRGLKYLRDSGVQVKREAREVRRNEERCYQCGTCTAVCPTGDPMWCGRRWRCCLTPANAAPVSYVARFARPGPWKSNWT